MILDVAYVVGFALCGILFILGVIRIAVVIFDDEKKKEPANG